MWQKAMMVFVFLFCGCSSNGLVDRVLMDSHYAQYQQERDDLERAYLHKEITYPEYKDLKAELDNNYSREVVERENVMRGEF